MNARYGLVEGFPGCFIAVDPRWIWLVEAPALGHRGEGGLDSCTRHAGARGNMKLKCLASWSTRALAWSTSSPRQDKELAGSRGSTCYL